MLRRRGAPAGNETPESYIRSTRTAIAKHDSDEITERLRVTDPDLIRRSGLAAVGLLWLAAIGWITWPIWPEVVQPPGSVTVVHWANGHLAGDDQLLPTLAQRFNAGGYRTAAGYRIQVRQYLVNSGSAQRELISRVQGRGPIRRELPDPAIVTPVAEHWLYSINDAAGAPIVETDGARSLASTWIGIATFKDMAECLGWPMRELGYEDIIALSADPDGWASRPCSRAEWGRQPLITYTDPNTSSTGRSVLYTLYSIAAGKLPEQLTSQDFSRPARHGLFAPLSGAGRSLCTGLLAAELRDLRRADVRALLSDR